MSAAFSTQRPTRFRHHEGIRQLVQETRLHKNDLVMPIFVHEGIKTSKAISSMPGIFQFPVSEVLSEVKRIADSGVNAVILFGIPTHKDAQGSEADNPKGPVQQTIQLIKKSYPAMVVIADCCLCEYTHNGHCFIHTHEKPNPPETLKRLQSIALSYAKAGADIVAPSGMIDGMVKAIRTALDEANYTQVMILSYAVKYASSFYGPFREAAGSSDSFSGDRKHHQMNPAQTREGLVEAELDVQEGADMLMVKPALPYLDMIKTLRDRFSLPIAAYQVSGEYALIKNGAANSLIDEKAAILETLTSIKRAGASIIITYFAVDAALTL